MGAGVSAGPVPPPEIEESYRTPSIQEACPETTAAQVHCEDALAEHLRRLDELAALSKLTGRYREAAAAETRALELRRARGEAMKSALLQAQAAQLTAAAALHEQAWGIRGSRVGIATRWCPHHQHTISHPTVSFVDSLSRTHCQANRGMHAWPKASSIPFHTRTHELRRRQTPTQAGLGESQSTKLLQPPAWQHCATLTSWSS